MAMPSSETIERFRSECERLEGHLKTLREHKNDGAAKSPIGKKTYKIL